MKALRWIARGLGLGIVAIVGFALPAVALDHIQSSDSVDCTGGCGEIRWEDYTKYSGARDHAADRWNDVGRINIAPDDAGSYTDLEWRDYSSCSANAYDAYWEASAGADVIKFNKCKMDDYSAFDRESIAVHELGHALRIRDHPNDRSTSTYWREHAIMYWNPKATNFNFPKVHDENDYDLSW